MKTINTIQCHTSYKYNLVHLYNIYLIFEIIIICKINNSNNIYIYIYIYILYILYMFIIRIYCI